MTANTEAPDADPEIGRLNRTHAIEGKVIFENRHGGAVAVLTHRTSSAVVALQGAQVLSYQTGDCGELLWLSPSAKLGTGKAVRGGIPICWPWFGPHSTDGALPAHGFVRARDFGITGALASDALTQLFLTFETSEDTLGLWRHHARVSLHIALGSDGLALKLKTSNEGPSRFELTQALHTYLRAGDIAGVTLEGLQGRPFVDQLDEHRTRREDGCVAIAGEVDRIYQESDDTVFVRDPTLGRQIRVDKSGSRSTVVWNPWIDKSARLGDLGDDGWRRMICVETANAGADFIALEPGAQHILAARISAQPI